VQQIDRPGLSPPEQPPEEAADRAEDDDSADNGDRPKRGKT